MPYIDMNPFTRLKNLPIFTPEMEEEVRRSLLSNKIMPRLETRLPTELDVSRPSRHLRNRDSQFSELRFEVNGGAKINCFEVSEEASQEIEERLKQDAMERLKRAMDRLCVPMGELSFQQRRLSAEVEQCVASVARSLDISMSEAFERCDRFLARHNTSWDTLAAFIANGLIHRFDVVNNELVLIAQEPLILRDSEVSLRMMSGMERGAGLNQVKPGIVGDATCKYNARSPHIRCAVNPCGPCDDCSHREEEKIEL